MIRDPGNDMWGRSLWYHLTCTGWQSLAFVSWFIIPGHQDQEYACSLRQLQQFLNIADLAETIPHGRRVSIYTLCTIITWRHTFVYHAWYSNDIYYKRVIVVIRFSITSYHMECSIKQNCTLSSRVSYGMPQIKLTLLTRDTLDFLC